jgi:hypothetical protein
VVILPAANRREGLGWQIPLKRDHHQETAHQQTAKRFVHTYPLRGFGRK